jgi:hypothetical protein
MQVIKVSEYAEEHEELKPALTKWGCWQNRLPVVREIGESGPCFDFLGHRFVVDNLLFDHVPLSRITEEIVSSQPLLVDAKDIYSTKWIKWFE